MSIESVISYSMWQTQNGHMYALSLSPQMKAQIKPVGYRRLTKKPCSACGELGLKKHKLHVWYELYKGRNGDWLCDPCAKSQNII